MFSSCVVIPVQIKVRNLEITETFYTYPICWIVHLQNWKSYSSFATISATILISTELNSKNMFKGSK